MEPKDHDILIEIKTQVTRLISDVRELKDDTARRVDIVEREKLSKEEFATYQKENADAHASMAEAIKSNKRIIDFLVSKYWWAVGIASTIVFIFGLFTAYILQHLP